ncbi:DnaJ domain-containing protein [bacterium]|nr:DnaJ domain-containing protein [bacterium]
MIKSSKNYYEILGVTPDVELSQLKAVYRRLVRKYHPDINPDGELIFKDITEAYEVLSDEKQRKQYDMINGFFKSSKAAENPQNTYRKSFKKSTCSNSDLKNGYKKEPEIKYKKTQRVEKVFTDIINDIIDGFSQSTRKKKAPNPPKSQKGTDIYADVTVTLKESVSGTHKIVNVVHTEVCEQCAGRKFINGSKCPKCDGKGEITKHQKINVTIPAHVKDGSKLRLSGEGKKGVNGGKNGDLYLKIKIAPDSLFKIDGNDLLCEVEISPFEAVLGGDIKVPSLEDSVVLKLPPCTRSGQIFRISSKGLKKNNLVGDIIVTVKIQIPEKISDEEIKLYKTLQELAGGNLRDSK